MGSRVLKLELGPQDWFGFQASGLGLGARCVHGFWGFCVACGILGLGGRRVDFTFPKVPTRALNSGPCIGRGALGGM